MSIKSTMLSGLAFGVAMALSGAASAADYDIDPTHSFVEFKIQHLGYSWLFGRFDKLAGTFTYDPAKPEASSINVETSEVRVVHCFNSEPASLISDLLLRCALLAHKIRRLCELLGQRS